MAYSGLTFAGPTFSRRDSRLLFSGPALITHFDGRDLGAPIHFPFMRFKEAYGTRGL